MKLLQFFENHRPAYYGNYQSYKIIIKKKKKLLY